MYKFNNIEEKVIFDKLTKNQIIGIQNDISNITLETNNTSVSFNSGKVRNYISEINGYIRTLEQTRENYAYRTLLSERKFIGYLIVFVKKVIRKLTKFYVEPIAFQQTEFNSAVTPIIGRMTEIQNELINGVVSLENRNEELSSYNNELNIKFEEFKIYNEKLNDEFEQIINRYIELENAMHLNNKKIKEQHEELEKSLLSKLDEYIKVQEISNIQIRNNKQELSRLNELDLDILKEKEFNFWDKKTVSQSGEDAICAYITMALGIPLAQCTYLDLGANHAKDLSNTYMFYTHGARGVLVEANPALIPELKFYRNEDIIINKCISVQSGRVVDFYVLSGDGLSTPDLNSANEFISKNPELKIVNKVQVETISVNDVFEQYFVNAPVIMNIDIEGKEIEILQSIDFNKYRPLIIIAEVIEYKTTLAFGNKNQEIINFMEKNNYLEYAFTGINSIFIDKTQIEEVK